MNIVTTKETSARTLLEKGYTLRVRNGSSYKLKIYNINNKEDLDHHISSNKMSFEDMSIDMKLQHEHGANFKLGCVDIDDKNIWDATVHYIESKPDFKVIINPTKRAGHLIFNLGVPSVKKIKAICNLGFSVDYLNQSVNVLAEGKYIDGEIPDISDLDRCPETLQMS